MLPLFARHCLPLAIFASVAAASSFGCSAAESDEASEGGTDALSTADALQEEVRLLGGSRGDVDKLLGIVNARVEAGDAKKAAAKVQAKKDVEAYTAEQWARSFFRRDEMESAIDARASDIFDRPERRALAGAKTQRQLVDELAKLLAAGTAGTLADPTPRAAYIRAGYVEIAISIQLTDEAGFGGQLMARIGHALQKTFPWLGKVAKGVQRDHRAAGLEGEAVNIDRTGPENLLWKKDPINSTAWRPRAAADVTPANLYRGPWFNGTAVPRMPKPGELWKLNGFRSQSSDGSHPSVDIANGDAEVKLKFRDQTDVFEEGPNPRIMWALGYDTDANYLFKEVRIEPRVLVAADTTVERIGVKFGPGEDTTIPGRPPKGLAISVNPIKKAPGAENITIHFKDGHDETGSGAIDSLKRAVSDRPFLDAMEFVTVRRVFGEVDMPKKRDAVGLWDFDANDHVDDREVRAIGIILGAWLGNSDVKFSNTRLDVERPKGGGEAKYFHALPDVGHLTRNFGFTVGMDPNDTFLHPDMNVSTIRAFDRLTTNDVKWAIARIASLSEAQILACVAAGAWSDEALALHTEKLIGRRDDLIKTFGLEKEFPLLRPQGPNQHPAARHFNGAE